MSTPGLYLSNGRVLDLLAWTPSVQLDPANYNPGTGPIYDAAHSRLYFATGFNPGGAPTGSVQLNWYDMPATIGHNIAHTINLPNGFVSSWGGALDPVTNRIFLSGGQAIQILDTNTNTFLTEWLLPGVQTNADVMGLWVDSVRRRLWVASQAGCVLYDLDSGIVITTAANLNAGAPTITTAANKVYAQGVQNINDPAFGATTTFNGLQIYDALTGVQLSFVLAGPVNGSAGNWYFRDRSPLVYLPSANKLYVIGVQKVDANNNLTGVIEVDCTTDTVTGILPIGWNEASSALSPVQPVGLFADTSTSLLYLTGSGNDPVSGLSGNLFKVITPAVSFPASAIVNHAESPNLDPVHGNNATNLVFAPYTAIPPPPTPGSPTGVVAYAGNHQVTIFWNAVPDGVGAEGVISGYTVTASNGTVVAAGDGTARSVVITGLPNGTPLTFTVTATNLGGATSAVSAPTTAVTPLGIVGSSTTALYTTNGTSVAALAKNGEDFAGINLELDPLKPYIAPQAVVADTTHNRIYVFCGNVEGDVHWYDIVTQTHATTPIGVSPQSLDQRFVAYDPTGNKIFLATAAAGGGVPVFDTTTNTVVATLATSGNTCAYIYVDEIHRRLWAVCQTAAGSNHNTVYIFDLDALTLVSTLIDYPDAAVFGWCRDPASSRVFTLQAATIDPESFSYQISPGIDVRDPLTGAILSSHSIRAPGDFFLSFNGNYMVPDASVSIAYSTSTQRIYITGIDIGSGSTLVIVVDPSTWSVSFDTHTYGYGQGSVRFHVEDVTGSLFFSYFDAATSSVRFSSTTNLTNVGLLSGTVWQTL